MNGPGQDQPQSSSHASNGSETRTARDEHRETGTVEGCRLARLSLVAGRVGIAGVVAALSVTSDLTRGHPPGEAMRACLLATELARRAGLDRSAGRRVLRRLMRFAGCAATSHEAAAALGGDDIAVRSRGDLIDATRPAGGAAVPGRAGPGVERLRMLARAPRVAAIVEESARADCEVGAD